MDRILSMQVYARVAETGSFTAAADELGLSRPMVSRHVMALEDELGVALMARTTRSVSLTEAGRDFLVRCNLILEQFDTAMREAGDQQVTPTGELRINCPYAFGDRHLVGGLAEFQSQHPGVSVELTMNDRMVDLVDEGYDLAVRIGVLEDSTLIARKLAEAKMVLCAAPDYLARHGRPAHPDELEAHNCLVYTYLAQGNGWRFRRGDQMVRVQPSGDFRSNYGGAVVEAGLAGRGVILEPDFMVGAPIAAGRLEPLLEDWRPPQIAIHAIYPQGRILPLKVRACIDHLAGYFERYPPSG